MTDILRGMLLEGGSTAARQARGNRIQPQSQSRATKQLILTDARSAVTPVQSKAASYNHHKYHSKVMLKRVALFHLITSELLDANYQ